MCFGYGILLLICFTKVVVEDNEVRFKPAIKEPVVLRNETALPHLLSVQHLERISNYNRDRGLLY